MIEHIYSDRRFKVSNNSISSNQPQRSGISQGCPLSPFLFVMLMAVAVSNASSLLDSEERNQLSNGTLEVLLYADDTLLIGEEGACLGTLLDKVVETGVRYGMELHW